MYTKVEKSQKDQKVAHEGNRVLVLNADDNVYIDDYTVNREKRCEGKKYN